MPTRQQLNPLSRPHSWWEIGTFLLTLTAVALAVLALHRASIVPIPALDTYYRASAITSDFRDVDLKINARTGQAQVIRTSSPLSAGASAAAAPLMDWENKDVREGRTMTWCLRGMDPAATQHWRDVLNELAALYPPPSVVEVAFDPSISRSGIAWREACPGSYTVGNTATKDCGGAPFEIVACAAIFTLPATSGRVSIAQEYLDKHPTLDGWKKVAMAHEGEHIVLNLGHNPCGRITDPITQQPVPSVMTPVLIEQGESCSDPPARGLVREDHRYAIDYYKFRIKTNPPPGGNPPLGGSPTPAPSPTPRPEQAVVLARMWVEAARTACATDPIPDGYWCGIDLLFPAAPRDGLGAAYSIGIRHPGGREEWRTGFPRIVLP